VPNDAINDTYDCSVNVILSTSKSSQQIYFNRIKDLYEIHMDEHGVSDSICSLVFISNAKVSVNGFQFNEIINNYWEFSYYELDKPGFIQPENEYNLLIINGNDTITGSTRVPKSFSIISHPRESTYTLYSSSETIKVFWEKSQNAKGYFYTVFYPSLTETWNGVDYVINRHSDTKLTKDTCVNIILSDDYDKYTIKVGAYDDNFDNYYNNKIYSSGVKGAYGVFCSIAVDSIIINVVKGSK
jgi:hypothetical protein